MKRLGDTSEQGQRRSSPDKSVLREEVAERRGASAKRSVSEEVTKKSSLIHHSLIH
jgi:hypothetical protein